MYVSSSNVMVVYNVSSCSFSSSGKLAGSISNTCWINLYPRIKTVSVEPPPTLANAPTFSSTIVILYCISIPAVTCPHFIIY